MSNLVKSIGFWLAIVASSRVLELGLDTSSSETANVQNLTVA